MQSCEAELLGVVALATPFEYALREDAWHARVGSLRALFNAVSEDRKRPTDASCVRAVWDKILPGLLERFDAAHALAAIAPRPILIANNAADPRCPRAGVEEAVAAAAPAWAGHESNLRVLLDESIAPSPLPASEWAKGHVITAGMWREIDDFLRANLKGV